MKQLSTDCLFEHYGTTSSTSKRNKNKFRSKTKLTFVRSPWDFLFLILCHKSITKKKIILLRIEKKEFSILSFNLWKLSYSLGYHFERFKSLYCSLNINSMVCKFSSLSAMISSPGDTKSKKPLCSVIYLSEELPPKCLK